MGEIGKNRGLFTGLKVLSLALGTAELVSAGAGPARRARRPGQPLGMLARIGGARERVHGRTALFGPPDGVLVDRVADDAMDLARPGGGPLNPQQSSER
jgi:hypothetical protein